MYETHTTKDGETMLICAMDDSHLFNTIRMYTNRMEAARAILQGSLHDQDPLIGIFQPQFSSASLKDQAQKSVKFCHGKLQPYVFEAALRGLNIQDLLQLAYGRSHAVGLQSLALPQGVTLSQALSTEDESLVYWDEDYGDER